MRNEDLQCLRKLGSLQPCMRVGLVAHYSLSRLIAMGLVASYSNRVEITPKGEATLARP
jgi:hypothetical protein